MPTVKDIAKLCQGIKRKTNNKVARAKLETPMTRERERTKTNNKKKT
jgi:hypothetical protein